MLRAVIDSADAKDLIHLLSQQYYARFARINEELEWHAIPSAILQRRVLLIFCPNFIEHGLVALAIELCRHLKLTIGVKK